MKKVNGFSVGTFGRLPKKNKPHHEIHLEPKQKSWKRYKECNVWSRAVYLNYLHLNSLLSFSLSRSAFFCSWSWGQKMKITQKLHTNYFCRWHELSVFFKWGNRILIVSNFLCSLREREKLKDSNSNCESMKWTSLMMVDEASKD